MYNFLVEAKQEYTIQLVNILAPLIYEGITSIYNEINNISTSDNILKNFQSGLSRIPKWNNQLIETETQRIMNNSKSFSWLEDLIKATLKANIIVLTYNPTVKNQIKIHPNLYQNIKINDFIHKCYIECARELWNNPYLLYHNYPPLELKRNQRETIGLIKDCIKEAIRKLLPAKYICQIYLGEDMVEENNNNDNFNETITEAESKNLNRLVKKDLYTNNLSPIPSETFNHSSNVLSNNNEDISKHNNVLSNSSETNLSNNQNNSSTSSDISSSPNINSIVDSHTVGSKILDIINNEGIKLSEPTIKKTDVPIKKSETINKHDNKIQKVLEELNNSETTVINNNLSNTKFQEIFSNSEQIDGVVQSSVQNKKSFFTKYLKI